MVKIAPSFLAADFLQLGRAVELVNSSADICHMDVMDGVFVPNISFGFPVVKAVAAMAEKPLDVHLMICDPAKYALKFAEIEGVEMVSFHLEACSEPDELLQSLRKAGVKAGLVINPDCPVERLFPHLEHCDFVLIMSVFAGFGGQKFIPETIDRIKALKAELDARGLDVEIEVDGGISPANSADVIAAGASVLVAGTSYFGAADPAKASDSMRGVN